MMNSIINVVNIIIYLYIIMAPYNKTYNGGARKKFRKRKRTKNGQQDERIKKLENLIYPSIEWKSSDITCTSASIPSTSYVNYPMFQLAQGHGQAQRIGDDVMLKSMNCSLSLTKGDSANIVRLLMVATPSSSHLVASDVLEYSDLSIHGEMVFSSPYRRRASNTEKTFQVLFDKIYNVTGNVNTLVDKFKCKLPKNGKKCTFQATGSQQPDNFNISVIAISDSTSVPHPAMGLVVRSKYIDL